MADSIPSGISKEISKYDFSPEIQSKSKEIYSWLDLDHIPRQSKRSKIICFCIHQAYIELYGKGPSPHLIASKINMESKHVNFMSTPPDLKKGFVLKSPTRDPVEYMHNYGKNALYLPDKILRVMRKKFEQVLIDSPQLLQEQLDPLVSSFILFYGEENGIEIDRDKIAKDFYLNLSTILLRENAMRTALAISS